LRDLPHLDQTPIEGHYLACARDPQKAVNGCIALAFQQGLLEAQSRLLLVEPFGLL
jgi:hypothetical protein